jgi:hypothetical protein
MFRTFKKRKFLCILREIQGFSKGSACQRRKSLSLRIVFFISVPSPDIFFSEADAGHHPSREISIKTEKIVLKASIVLHSLALKLILL